MVVSICSHIVPQHKKSALAVASFEMLKVLLSHPGIDVNLRDMVKLHFCFTSPM